ncbi:MAG: tagaturonate epimerase family protein [Pirellulales bacterium]|nr:tagaturonate epimerase family protein [Pirellulales bacterium]
MDQEPRNLPTMTSHLETPCTTLGIAPSFGFGDRIGLATAGHVEAMQRAGAGIQPIFPQQSIREMLRTGRSPDVVMRCANQGMRSAGWTGQTGADADHLKTTEDIDATAAAGFTFFTIDPSDRVDARADSYNQHELREKFSAVRSQIDWWEIYLDQAVVLPTGTRVLLDEEACMRCAVKYGLAINLAVLLGDHIGSVQAAGNCDYEIELSVDETEQPTTLAEHYIIADQCLRRGMKLVSLAPRFLGDFEKGVDYKGDVEALRRSLDDHFAISSLLGPYKLSLHSGSDKLSIYGPLARSTRGHFHVKTAGTSYLEALRVVLRHDEGLFRQIVKFARQRYDTDKATYHVSATLDSVPPPDEISESTQLEQLYLERWCDVPMGKGFLQPGRQILHCTFGSVLTHPEFGSTVHELLESHIEVYTEILAEHFERHLLALTAEM